jgi:hypothetical protein
MFYSVPIEIPKKKPTYDWSDVYFLATSENQPFDQAKIITTKTAFRNQIYQQALSVVLDKYPNWGYRDNKRAENFLRKTERELLKKCEGSVCEGVTHLYDGTIQIVVNVDDVNTDEAIERALQLYSEFTSDNKSHRFEKQIKFSATDFNFDQFDEDEYVC